MILTFVSNSRTQGMFFLSIKLMHSQNIIHVGGGAQLRRLGLNGQIRVAQVTFWVFVIALLHPFPTETTATELYKKKPRIPQQQFPNTACLVPNRINIKLCENDGNGNSGSSSSHCWLCSTLHMWGGVCQAPSRVTGKHSHSSTSIAHAQVVPSSWSTSNCLDVFLT